MSERAGRATSQAVSTEDVGTLFPRVGAWSVTGTNRRHRSHQATGALRSAGWTSAPQYWQRWVSDGVGRDGSVGTGVTVGGVLVLGVEEPGAGGGDELLPARRANAEKRGPQAPLPWWSDDRFG